MREALATFAAVSGLGAALGIGYILYKIGNDNTLLYGVVTGLTVCAVLAMVLMVILASRYLLLSWRSHMRAEQELQITTGKVVQLAKNGDGQWMPSLLTAQGGDRRAMPGEDVIDLSPIDGTVLEWPGQAGVGRDGRAAGGGI